MTFHPTKNPVFWQETADTCFAEERFEKAAEAYLRVCELTPGNAQAWAGRGKALMHLEAYADAADCLERSLVIEPDNGENIALLGSIYEKLGIADKAAACMIRSGELSQ
ncbi:MAG TPA: tetratricopeptide repeat protein [Methanocorpusculum sp.]|nr:tetratricopeptide repeat protein [Methanocorpusculum sp.]